MLLATPTCAIGWPLLKPTTLKCRARWLGMERMARGRGTQPKLMNHWRKLAHKRAYSDFKQFKKHRQAEPTPNVGWSMNLLPLFFLHRKILRLSTSSTFSASIGSDFIRGVSVTFVTCRCLLTARNSYSATFPRTPNCHLCRHPTKKRKKKKGTSWLQRTLHKLVS